MKKKWKVEVKLPRIFIERGDKIESEEDDPSDIMWKEDNRNFWAIEKAVSSKRKGDRDDQEVKEYQEKELEVETNNPKKGVKLDRKKSVFVMRDSKD